MELTFTLSYSRLRGPAFRLNYEGKGVGSERYLLLVGHICICFDVKRKRKSTRKGGEGGLTLGVGLAIIWSMGNSIPELTLTSFHNVDEEFRL